MIGPVMDADRIATIRQLAKRIPSGTLELMVYELCDALEAAQAEITAIKGQLTFEVGYGTKVCLERDRLASQVNDLTAAGEQMWELVESALSAAASGSEVFPYARYLIEARHTATKFAPCPLCEGRGYLAKYGHRTPCPDCRLGSLAERPEEKRWACDTCGLHAYSKPDRSKRCEIFHGNTRCIGHMVPDVGGSHPDE